MPSPFDKKRAGGTATATAPAQPASAPEAPTSIATQPAATTTASALPAADSFSGDGLASDDPYMAADPTGISGYKPIAFMNQLILLHPDETGRMKTKNSANQEDGKSPYARVDVIPLTVPEQGVSPSKDRMAATADGYVVLNKDGDEELFEPYEIGERLDGLVFFNKPLVAEAERAIKKGNAWLLGRISRGEAKEGQSSPIILQAASAEDKAYYAQWRKAQTAG